MRESLSQYWSIIQGTLFPSLKEEMPPLLEKHYEVIACLEIVRIEEFIKTFRGCVGRPVEDRGALARAFIAKAIYTLPTTVQLIDRLRCDASLRRICGWERKSYIPSEATFSRAFREFAESSLPHRVHEALILSSHSERLVGHISEDSTTIEAREKSIKKPKEKKGLSYVKKKRGRKKKGEADRYLTLAAAQGMNVPDPI